MCLKFTFFKASICIFFYKFSISEIRNEKDKLINGMNEIESQIAVYDTINGDDIDKYKMNILTVFLLFFISIHFNLYLFNPHIKL